MKALFDANIVVDIWTESQDCLYSLASVDVALMRGFEPLIAATIVPSVEYLFGARAKMPRERVRSAMGALLELFGVLDVTEGDCQRAYGEDAPDFEDAIIYQCAYRNNVDVIVTRNKADFAHSPVPAMTPQQFVEAYKPANIDYAEVTVKASVDTEG